MILIGLATLFLMVALANVFFWPAVSGSRDSASVAILIPARNEEATLPACLRSALATTACEILVYDDHSSDGTAGVVRAFHARDSRVRLIESCDLPPNWAGKPFACHMLAAAAHAEWLLFLDADAWLSKAAPERMVAGATARRLTFLSCWPRLEMLGLAERALMPSLNFVVFALCPAALSMFLNLPSLGLAHGACILAQATTYRRLGGHELVREEMFEDTRLAQTWRARGERGMCLDGGDIVRVRMYEDLGGIWAGFQKNFYPAFRSPVMFFAFLLLHMTVFLSPFLIHAWLAIGIVLATRLAIAIRFRHPLWSVPLHPFCEVFLLLLGMVSFWRCASRRGVVWKGRVYRTS